MERLIRWIRVISFYFLILFYSFCFVFPTMAAEDTSLDIGLEEYDFSQIQQVLNDTELVEELSFMDIVKSLLSGNFSTFVKQVGQVLKSKLLAEVGANTRALSQIIMIGIIGAVFTNLSSVFTKNQISETGFYITYLLLVTLLAAAFTLCGSIAKGVVQSVVDFMYALVPSYFLAVAFSGGSVTSIAMYEFTLFLITAVQWILLNLMIPLVHMYVLLHFVNNISKEDFLSKLADLLKTIIEWGLKTILGLVIGFQLIQGMVLPYVDNMKTSAVNKVIQVIPGIGQGAGAITNLIMGSGVLIKNGIGGAALVIIAVLCAVPLVKLAVLSLMYQGCAAVIQPVSDKRIVGCISCIADGSRLLLKIVFTAALLFIITIAAICASTNVAYFTG